MMEYLSMYSNTWTRITLEYKRHSYYLLTMMNYIQVLQPISDDERWNTYSNMLAEMYLSL